MLTCYISEFRKSYHGGAHGGALLIECWSSSLLQKSHFFGCKLAHRCFRRPPIAPPCMPKFAHPFAPPFLRPSMRPTLIAPPVASKMWVFHENNENSSASVAIRSLPSPMRPPYDIVAKFMIWAQFFPIIIFHKNVFLLLYRPNP